MIYISEFLVGHDWKSSKSTILLFSEGNSVGLGLGSRLRCWTSCSCLDRPTVAAAICRDEAQWRCLTNLSLHTIMYVYVCLCISMYNIIYICIFEMTICPNLLSGSVQLRNWLMCFCFRWIQHHHTLKQNVCPKQGNIPICGKFRNEHEVQDAKPCTSIVVTGCCNMLQAEFKI